MSVESTRPRKHDGTSPIEQQIFAATERLLAHTSARDLSVGKILEEAGIARGSFYHYFESKWDVVLKLARTVMEAIYARIAPFVQPEADDPREGLRRSIAEGCRLWSEHRAVVRVITEHWREVPELRTMWLEAMNQFVDGISATIERERERGRIAPGVDSRQLATVLMWSTAQSLYIAGLHEVDDLPDEAAAQDGVTALWMGTLYGQPA
jgi:TetR/AcrR family transcriptional regulator, ethionamide resistance regulator